jgi:hypothetical protein
MPAKGDWQRLSCWSRCCHLAAVSMQLGWALFLASGLLA